MGKSPQHFGLNEQAYLFWTKCRGLLRSTHFDHTRLISEAAMWPSAPSDAFALMGYRCNKCYVAPALDLVIARVGAEPATWEEQGLIGDVLGAIVE